MKTVLILEDDASILGLIRLVVAKNGYGVLEAASAEQAFNRFEEVDAAVDLLIADVTLPGSSGIRVALELRSLLPYLKIIITSGFPKALWNDQDAAELDELPSDSVITLQKPFLPSILLESVHRMIGYPLISGLALKMNAVGQ